MIQRTCNGLRLPIWSVAFLLMAGPGCSGEEEPDVFKQIDLQLVAGNFTAPESALFDNARNVWYISNFGQPFMEPDQPGWITRLSAEGTVMEEKWIQNVADDPKGMGIIGDTLFVAGNQSIVEIDLVSETIVYEVPVEQAQFLNGMAVAFDRLIIADSATDYLFEYVPGGVPTPLINLSDRAPAPNGVALGGNGVIITTLGGFPAGSDTPPGRMFEVASDGTVTQFSNVQGAMDGIAATGNGFVVSDFKGSVYRVSSDGATSELIADFTRGGGLTSAAAVGFSSSTNRVMVPDLLGGKVAHFSLARPTDDDPFIDGSGDGGVETGTPAESTTTGP
jgi:hypothetical protein